MKIHVLYNCYWGNGMSGGDRRLIEILRQWQEDKNDQIILYTDKRFADLLVQENIYLDNVFVTDSAVENANIVLTYHLRTVRCRKALLENIEKGDIIYSPTDIMPDVLPAISAKKKYKGDIRWYMITYHIFEKFYKRPGNLIVNFMSCYQQKYDISAAQKYSDKIMSTSIEVLDYLKSKKLQESKLSIIDCAVDIDLIENSQEKAEKYDAVFLARLNYSKGIKELPIIWKNVCAEIPNARLAIIGTGADEIIEELKTIIHSNGVDDSVDLKGYMSAEDAYSLMKESKLFLFTSHEEGWGMAIAEAMVCGLPVVAYDLPVYHQVFKKGIIVSSQFDTKEIADNVVLLLNNENERKRVGEEGKRFVLDHYSFEKTAEREWSLLNSID